MLDWITAIYLFYVVLCDKIVSYFKFFIHTYIINVYIVNHSFAFVQQY